MLFRSPSIRVFSKSMVFPVVMYGCESWTIKKAEHQRMDAFELWCWRRLLMSDSLLPHGLQHARLPCPSPIPGVHSNPMSIESVMPSSHLILCCPLLLLPSIFPRIMVFSNESVLRVRWPFHSYWSCSFSLSPSNEYSGMISFRIDC